MRISADCIEEEVEANERQLSETFAKMSLNSNACAKQSVANKHNANNGNNGERVKVIYRYSSPALDHSVQRDGYVPLTVIPIVDDKFHDGYYSNWDEVKNQVLNLNFKGNAKSAQSVSFVGKVGVGSVPSYLPLVTKDDYFTALKVAELCGEPLDVMIKDNREKNTAEKESHSESGAIPKQRSSLNENVISDTSDAFNNYGYACADDSRNNASDETRVEVESTKQRLINSISQSERNAFLTNSQIARLKREITADVTKRIINKLSECLNDLECDDKDEPDFANDLITRDVASNAESTAKSEAKESNAKSDAVIHNGIICDHCDRQIEGIRYKCSVCLDYDLCEKCELLSGIHNEDHSFIKIKQPVKRFQLPQNNEDIYLALDVDIPTGKINFGDVKVVSKPYKSPNLNSNASSNAAQTGVPTTAAPHKSTPFTNKSRGSEKKAVKIAKKLEKLKIKGQMYGNLLQGTDERMRSMFMNHETKLNTGSNQAIPANSLFLSGIFVSDETIPEGTKMPPSTKFRKTWRVRNTGSKVWSGRTTLRYVWGHTELEPYGKVTEIQAPPLKPGEEGRITIRFTAPKSQTLALYQSHWRLHHRGQPFGQRLICRIVVDPTINSVTQPNTINRSQSLRESAISARKDSKNQRDKHLEDAFTTAVKAIRFSLGDNEHIPMKMNVKSHTTTPANTPFDISPPKSPEPLSLSNSMQSHENAVIDNKELNDFTENKSNDVDDAESASILSLSSNESGDEFVVVPLPRCFDLNLPFIGSDNDININETNSNQHEQMVDNGFEELNQFNVTENDILLENNINNASDNSVTSNESIQLPDSTTDNSPADVVIRNQATAQSNHLELNASNAIIIDKHVEQTAVKEVEPNTHSGGIHFLEGIARNISTMPTMPAMPPKAKCEMGDKPQSTTAAHSTNPFRDAETENVIHVLPESIVTGALSAAAHVYNNVSRALFPRNEGTDSRHFAWITSPPPAAIPLPERYWEASRQQHVHQYQPHEYFSTTSASTNSTLTTTTNNAGSFTTTSAKSSVMANGSPTAPSAESQPQTQRNGLADGLSQLYEMGFWNQKLNQYLLEKNSYDVNDTIEDLLSPDRGRQRRSVSSDEVVSQQPSHVNRKDFIEEFD